MITIIWLLVCRSIIEYGGIDSWYGVALTLVTTKLLIWTFVWGIPPLSKYGEANYVSAYRKTEAYKRHKCAVKRTLILLTQQRTSLVRASVISISIGVFVYLNPKLSVAVFFGGMAFYAYYRRTKPQIMPQNIEAEEASLID